MSLSCLFSSSIVNKSQNLVKKTREIAHRKCRKLYSTGLSVIWRDIFDYQYLAPSWQVGEVGSRKNRQTGVNSDLSEMMQNLTFIKYWKQLNFCLHLLEWQNIAESFLRHAGSLLNMVGYLTYHCIGGKNLRRTCFVG